MLIGVTFWGTRGSIPVPTGNARMRDRLRRVLMAAGPGDVGSAEAVDRFIDRNCNGALPTIYGGDTACVEVSERDGPRLILDAGSGIRGLAGAAIARHGPVAPEPWHILMSHFHWDHIMGFPFFAPAYIPGNVINIYGCHPEIEEAFRRQHGAPSFPVPFDALPAEIRFHVLDPETSHEINGFHVTPHLLNHGGKAYAYKLERQGRAIVYASDAEHKPEMVGPDYPYVDFIRGADLLIFDAQYSLAESVSVREDWGHSSNVVGVELALLGRVGTLALFHHEPLNSDEKLDEILADARRMEEILRDDRPPVRVIGAHDGLELRF